LSIVFILETAIDGRRIVAISDNAAYHRATLHKAWREKQAPLFELDFLGGGGLSASRLARWVHNRYFGFLDGVVEAVQEQLAEWAKPNETLRHSRAST
jgi:hypothetical protein